MGRVAVIGGGPGGYAAAFRAADLGQDVLLISDEEHLGGVCLLRGCIPSKALLEVVHLRERARAAAEMGLHLGEGTVDLQQLRSWKDLVVETLVSGLDRLARRRRVEVVRGQARFADEDRIVVVDGRGDESEIGFDHAVLAAGSEPVPLPGVEFTDRVMSSKEALQLGEVPQRLLVVGAGYVGLELGTVYAELGSRVTLIEATDQILPGADPELAEPLAESLARRFAKLQFETMVSEIDEKGEEVRVSIQDGGEATFDRAIVAVGRRPRVASLGLENAGVEVEDSGVVQVDERRRTSAERIYAVGDVTGGEMLAHEAMHEGRIAAEVVAGQPAAFDVRAVPAIVYTDPQVAWVGSSAGEAEDMGLGPTVERFPWQAAGRAQTMGETTGMTKLIISHEGRLLGAGFVGPRVEDLVSEAALAIEMGVRAADLSLTIHPHPTLSETLGEAASILAWGNTTHL